MAGNFPPRRHHERYACSLSTQVRLPGSNRPVDCQILNISIGGAFLRLGGSVAAGDNVWLELESNGERFQIKARVVRVGGKDPKDLKSEVCGVTFLADSKAQDKLRLMIDRIRAALPSSGPMKTPNYWKL